MLQDTDARGRQREANPALRKVSGNRNSTPPTLAELAYTILEEMIVTLALPPGHLISEAELQRNLNLGRTPLREALQRLASERLVKITPRRGMVVTHVDARQQLMILRVRRPLDRLLVLGAAENLDGEQKAAMLQCARDIVAAAKANDAGSFMRADRLYDQIVEEACDNQFAVDAAAPLHAHSRRFWYMYKRDRDLVQSAKRHAAVMRAIGSGDADRIEEAQKVLMDYLWSFAGKILGSRVPNSIVATKGQILARGKRGDAVSCG